MLGIVASSAGGGGGPFDPADLFTSEAGGYWDFMDLATMRVARDGTGPAPALTDRIGYVPDKSPNGNHLSTDTDARRMTCVANGAQSTGTDANLFKVFGAAIAQPYEIVVCLNQLTYTLDARLIAPNAAGTYLLQGDTSGKVRPYNSGYGTAVNPGLTTEAVIDIFCNGGSSTISLDNGSHVASSMGGSSQDAVILGADASGGLPTSFVIKRLLIIARALTGGERTSLYSAMIA